MATVKAGRLGCRSTVEARNKPRAYGGANRRRLLCAVLQVFRIPDKFVPAWMLAKITIAEREGTPTKSSLFWHKAIGQIHPPHWFYPTFFNIENLACMRLAYHYRPRFMALSHNAGRVVFALHEKPNVKLRGGPFTDSERSPKAWIFTKLQNRHETARPFERHVRLEIYYWHD